MDKSLTMETQVTELKKQCFHSIRNINKIRSLLSKDQIAVIVNSFVLSCLDYCNSLYYGIGQKLLQQLQLIQNAASKLVTGKLKRNHMNDELNKID